MNYNKREQHEQDSQTASTSTKLRTYQSWSTRSNLDGSTIRVKARIQGEPERIKVTEGGGRLEEEQRWKKTRSRKIGLEVRVTSSRAPEQQTCRLTEARALEYRSDRARKSGVNLDG